MTSPAWNSQVYTPGDILFSCLLSGSRPEGFCWSVWCISVEQFKKLPRRFPGGCAILHSSGGSPSTPPPAFIRLCTAAKLGAVLGGGVICISLVTDAAEHLFVYTLTFSQPSVLKYLVKSFALLKIGLFCLFTEF